MSWTACGELQAALKALAESVSVEAVGSCLSLFEEAVAELVNYRAAAGFEAMRSWVVEQLYILGEVVAELATQEAELKHLGYWEQLLKVYHKAFRYGLVEEGEWSLASLDRFWVQLASAYAASGEAADEGGVLNDETPVEMVADDVAADPAAATGDEEDPHEFAEMLGSQVLAKHADLCYSFYDVVARVLVDDPDMDKGALCYLLRAMPCPADVDANAILLEMPRRRKSPQALYQTCVKKCVGSVDDDLAAGVLRGIGVKEALCFETVIECGNMFVELWTRKEGEEDLDSKLWIARRLFAFGINAELAAFMGEQLNKDMLAGMLYSVLCVELFACEEKELVMECYEPLLAHLSSVQLSYLFRKLIVVAATAPLNATLWCIHVASLILIRCPNLVVPMFHVNPTYADALRLRDAANVPLALPAQIPARDGPPQVEPQHAAVSQLCAYELVLLKNHVSPAVRSATQLLLAVLTDPALTLKAQSGANRAAEVSVLDVVNAAALRCMKRLALSQELP